MIVGSFLFLHLFSEVSLSLHTMKKFKGNTASLSLSHLFRLKWKLMSAQHVMFSHFPEHFQFMEIKLIFNFTKAHTVSAFHNQGREERRLELHQKFCSCDAVILKVRCFFWESSYSNSIHSLNFLEFHFPLAENKSFLILRQVNSFEIL